MSGQTVQTHIRLQFDHGLFCLQLHLFEGLDDSDENFYGEIRKITHLSPNEPHHEKQHFAYAKTK